MPHELEDDWETTALRRVAGRIGSLPERPADPDPKDVADDGYDWEDTVIRRLRAWWQREFSDR